MEQEGLEQITGTRSDKNQAKRRFRWVNPASIMLALFVFSMTALIYYNFRENINEAIGNFFYSIKPLSILDFHKLDTTRPKGEICRIEADENKEIAFGIIYQKNQIDIYDSLKFEKLIKTIKVPGLIENVKCMYSNVYEESFLDSSLLASEDEAKIGFGKDKTAGLVMGITYVNKNKRILRRMHIPNAKLTHWNYVHDTKRDRSKEQSWLLYEEIMVNHDRKTKNLPEIKLQIDENPKNPFEYLETDYWYSLGDKKLLSMDEHDTYLTSSDGSIVYNIGNDKIVRKYFKNDKTTIWSYTYTHSRWVYLFGFDGRYALLPNERWEFEKIDSGKNANLDESFFISNSGDGIFPCTFTLIWNGKNLLCINNMSTTEMFVCDGIQKPVSTVSTFLNYPKCSSLYIHDDWANAFSTKFDYEAKVSYSIPFGLRNIRIYDFLMATFSFDKKGNPLIIITSNEHREKSIALLNVKNIDEPVTDFYVTTENSRPVFYLMNEKSIYRWENSTDSMGNLKPEIVNFGETNKLTQ